MKNARFFTCSLPRLQTGVALIELALVLPLFVTLTFMVTEVGRAFYEYNTIAKSVRDAVRYLSAQDPLIAESDPDKKLDVAQNLVVFGLPSPGTSPKPLLPGLSLSNVPLSNISWSWSDTEPRIRTVKISVTGYTFRPMLSQVFGLKLGNDDGTIPFGSIEASMRAPG